jgi:hypothetical protein
VKGENQMDEKQIQVMNRLLKKLSAMRATLSNEEQELLDQIVVFPQAEVEAHRYDPRYDPRADPRQDPRFDPQKQPGADEVEAHRYDPRADPRQDPRYDPQKQPWADEVEAHQKTPSADSRAVPRQTPQPDYRIIFDAKTQVYKMTP